MSIVRSLPGTAVALAAVFFGIAAYITLAEQPARLALDAGPMLAQWQISFRTGIVIQGSLAIVAGLAGLAAWWWWRDWRWIVGSAFMLVNWPWTLVLIAPVNAALLGTAPGAAGAASRALVERWGELHAMRAGLGLLALLLFVWAASRCMGGPAGNGRWQRAERDAAL
jgi:hypothetical protein